jgi:hypothetical protein
MSIRQFLDDPGAFDAEATASMGRAFDAACKGLHDTGQPYIVREVIAKRIIAAAMTGELDPDVLYKIALVGLTGAQRE